MVMLNQIFDFFKISRNIPEQSKFRFENRTSAIHFLFYSPSSFILGVFFGKKERKN